MASQLHVPIEYQRHYDSSSIYETEVGAGITNYYLHGFAHPALYHLLYIFGVHHGELEQHLSLLETLYAMVSRLIADASNFGVENWVTIINLREVVQGLHNYLTLVDSVSKVFTRQQVASAVTIIHL